MTQPLALVYYEKLMPGSQLVNKLQDLNYRVQTVNEPAAFQSSTPAEKPLLAIADLAGGDAICGAIAALKADAATSPSRSSRSPPRARLKRWTGRKGLAPKSLSAKPQLQSICRSC
jgi:hypothetical protein